MPKFDELNRKIAAFTNTLRPLNPRYNFDSGLVFRTDDNIVYPLFTGSIYALRLYVLPILTGGGWSIEIFLDHTGSSVHIKPFVAYSFGKETRSYIGEGSSMEIALSLAIEKWIDDGAPRAK